MTHDAKYVEPSLERRPGAVVHLDEWVTPDVADDRGFLRAGKILEWMDVAGVLVTTRHSRYPVMTASIRRCASPLPRCAASTYMLNSRAL